MTTAIRRTVASSELSRHSAAVFRDADQGPVEITRRDGDTLVLQRKSTQESQVTALNLAADLIAASLGPEETPFVERLRARFPWMVYLTPEGREQFASEIVESARAAASIGNFTPFLVDLIAWRDTAAAKVSGFVADADLEWLDEEMEPVPHPGT